VRGAKGLRGFPSRPMLVRFWERVNKNGSIPLHRPDLGCCWLWTGCVRSKRARYGQLATGRPKKGNKVETHIFSWELHTASQVPDGLCVCHHCDNASCVRPSHLFLGTPKDNFDDMRTKGRGQHFKAILSDSQVVDIRNRLASTTPPSKVSLAREFGVSPGAIHRIHDGRRANQYHIPGTQSPMGRRRHVDSGVVTGREIP
jgi:HNH endonuclease